MDVVRTQRKMARRVVSASGAIGLGAVHTALAVQILKLGKITCGTLTSIIGAVAYDISTRMERCGVGALLRRQTRTSAFFLSMTKDGICIIILLYKGTANTLNSPPLYFFGARTINFKSASGLCEGSYGSSRVLVATTL